MCRSQCQLDFAQPGHIILHNDRIIVLEIQADVRTERRALGEQNQMLQHEIPLDDFRSGFRLSDTVLTLTKNSLLFGIVAAAPKRELLGRRLDLHEFAEGVHVPDNLLEVRGGHRDDAGEFHRRDLDGIDVDFNELQTEPSDTLLLTVQDFDPELCGILLIHKEHDALVVGDRLDELEEVDHVDA